MDHIKEFVDQIVEDGIITTDEHDRFMEMVHSDGEIDESESAQISRIFTLLSEGKIQIVNPEQQVGDREAIAEHKSAMVSEDIENEAVLPAARPELDEAAREELHAAIKKVSDEKEKSRNKISEFLDEKREKLVKETQASPRSPQASGVESQSVLHQAKRKLDTIN